MTIKSDYLVKVNNKNRIQRILLKLNKSDNENVYTLKRITGQLGGKETKQPDIIINIGKAGRTVAEQSALIYNSHLKKYLDGGYSLLSKLTSKEYSDLTEEEIKILLGGSVTDQSGVPKPMLAKLADQCSPNIFESNWFVSRKLDGTRCLMYWKDNQVHTASRGGGEYNVSTTHIRTNEKLIQFFQSNPDVILDGELYKHDSLYPLQKISGLARLKEWNDECSALEYWIYDYISKDPFKTRWENLKSWKDLIESENIKILDQKEMSGYLSIKREHDKYVQEGFEGLCMRNPEKEYGINKRSGVYLVKMKEYKDDEFEVTGIKSGLRPEDMCFTLKTAEGKEFSAKPMGDVSTRIYYLEHPDEFIGKMATCKFFYYSNDKIPLQPILKHFRPEGE